MTAQQKLEAENIRLKIIINQLQATLADRNFQLERIRLKEEQDKFVVENELRNFNWNTLSESNSEPKLELKIAERENR